MIPTYLMVPVVLDALILEEGLSVPAAYPNFSKLPWTDGVEDYNPSQPFISENIADVPFPNKDFRLRRGVHLHWALPDALTQIDLTQKNGPIYPKVPDQWVIIKQVKGEDSGQWVVQSSYLYPTGEGQNSGAITIPWNLENYVPGTPPYKYLGRTIALGAWQGTTDGDYWQDLTAVGYGDPAFAAFYPKCRGVFGFHDPEIPIVGTQYSILGFYSDETADLIYKYTNNLPPNTTFSDWEKGLEDVFHWSSSPEAKNQPLPNQMVCYAAINIGQDTGSPPPDYLASSASVTVGNSGAEALSAWLASRIAKANQTENEAWIYEDQLESAQIIDYLNSQSLDIAARFYEARHSNGFVGEKGGTLWALQRRLADNSPQNAGDSLEIQFSENWGDALNYLNQMQENYQSNLYKIENLRAQLFADWYKYMIASYPAGDMPGSYPAADEIAFFINQKSIREIAQLEGETGRIEFTFDSEGNLASSNYVGQNQASMASKLSLALNELLNQIKDFNETPEVQQAGTTFYLNAVESPRFWVPSDPSIVITGDIAQVSQRHGFDGLLPCLIVNNEGPVIYQEKPNSELNKAFQKFLDQYCNAKNEPGYYQWTAQPWNPLLLDWEAKYYPIQAGSNISSTGNGNYAPEFIQDNYELPFNASDLRLKQGAGETIQAAKMLRGHSYLTDGPGEFLKSRLVKTLIYNTAPVVRTVNPNEPPAEELSARSEAEQAQDILNDLALTETSGSTAKLSENPNLTLAKGLDILNKTTFLSQSLDGFNAGLIQLKKTLQLPLLEPIGFAAKRAFTDQVADTVGKFNQMAPMPLNPYFPIRAGEVKLSKLEILDSFGRYASLPLNHVGTAYPMRPNQPELHDFSVSPRIQQPARIQFRWLSAIHEVAEMNEHPDTNPVCGWIVPNFADTSLWVYNSLGQSLGLIDPTATWNGAPGSDAAVYEVYNLENQHLRKVVEKIIQQGPIHLANLLSTLANGLDNSSPENYNQVTPLSLLYGRPMAVVRAVASLQIKGTKAINQSWEALRQDLSRDFRGTSQFGQVDFPIRLGEHQQLNDGLIGYWLENEAGAITDSAFYAPQSEAIQDSQIITYQDGPDQFSIPLNLQSPPKKITMLMDIRGKVHITSGILPVKALDIPPAQYTDALNRMEISFLTAPLITEVNRLSASLPNTPGFSWKWVERYRGSWIETDEILPPETNASFAGPYRLVEGWLKITKTPETE